VLVKETDGARNEEKEPDVLLSLAPQLREELAKQLIDPEQARRCCGMKTKRSFRFLRIPMKPAMHSNLKPATRSDLKPSMVAI
jgi:hypothetical protein